MNEKCFFFWLVPVLVSYYQLQIPVQIHLREISKSFTYLVLESSGDLDGDCGIVIVHNSILVDLFVSLASSLRSCNYSFSPAVQFRSVFCVYHKRNRSSHKPWVGVVGVNWKHYFSVFSVNDNSHLPKNIQEFCFSCQLTHHSFSPPASGVLIVTVCSQCLLAL